ncbi:MAG: hypothetical protein JWR73_2254, partial [Tardiphaga sp.]|nr:hypothetical protein [Tardiphaga sp.]
MPHRFSRRHFTQLASALPLAASAAAIAPSAESQGAENAAQRAPRFPDNFIWGTATSAYQI